MAEQNEAAEPVKNCAECKKPIKRSRRYYRNGAYYCNKNCYKKKAESLKSEAQASGDAPSPAEEKAGKKKPQEEAAKKV